MARTQPPRYKELHLGQFRAFLMCVQSRSYSAAARAMGLSHSAVWQQVRALERLCGVALVQRQGRQLRPTEDGRLFLEQISPIIGAMDSLLESFDQTRRELPRTLTVLSAPSILLEELRLPAAAFCQEHPEIKLKLISVAIFGGVEQLVSGEGDLAILSLDNVESVSPHFTAEPLSERHATLVLPEGHTLARKRRLTLADLVREPLILPEPESPWRKSVEEVFRRAGLLPRLQVRIESNLSLALRGFVREGLGPALQPVPAEVLPLSGICFRSVREWFPSQAVYILWRRGVSPRPQARLFADFLRGSAGRNARP